MSALHQIIPSVQHYDWGTLGSSSYIYQLLSNSSSFFTAKIPTSPSTINPPTKTLSTSLPYAELWMGTHSSSPSLVLPPNSNNSLSETPKELSCVINSSLPFLFKVLSIAKPLSIQAHPSSSQAPSLHKNFPKLYPDPNAKPELVIPIKGNLTLLSSFLPSKHYPTILSYSPTLTQLLNSPTNPEIKSIILTLLQLSPDQISIISSEFISNITPDLEPDQHTWIQTILSTNQQHDVGFLVGIFMNKISLPESHAMFMEAGEVHAYIHGTVIEVMGNSDNVLRMGLTSKPKDLPNAEKVVNWQGREGGGQRIEVEIDKETGTGMYKVPGLKEFEVWRTELKRGEKEEGEEKGVKGVSLILSVEGDGEIRAKGEEEWKQLKAGGVWYVEEGKAIQMRIGKDSNNFVTFRAFAPTSDEQN